MTDSDGKIAVAAMVSAKMGYGHKQSVARSKAVRAVHEWGIAGMQQTSSLGKCVIRSSSGNLSIP